MWWLHVIRQWALADRVRTSAKDGKLLRLRVGACVRVGGVPGQVTARAVDDQPKSQDVDRADAGAPANVEYTCRTATGSFRLRVRPTTAGVSPSPVVRAWVQPVGPDGIPPDCSEEEIHIGDVEVFG
jgi:hypothetical protein